LTVTTKKGEVYQYSSLEGLVKVYFWGTRGSLPASYTSEIIRKKIFNAIKASQGLKFHTDEDIKKFICNDPINRSLNFSATGSYGSNTSCMEIEGGDDYIICDAGTGLRDFGNHIMKSVAKGPQEKSNVFNIFISHLHWDHIQGFPFFVPAFIPGNQVHIYGLHKELEHAFITQQEYPFFPIPLKSLSADIRFTMLEENKEYKIAGFTVKGIKQNHPGDSYGYRFEKDGKSIVYSTDSEHKENACDEEYSFLNFFKNADLLVFDAQYSFADATSAKENWGHSNNIVAVELSVKAGVKHLCIYHNEPTFDDEGLDDFLENTRRYLKIYSETSQLTIDIAYDGMQIGL
jgi:phosphoribosyl 1,2-cyclic phosphodiesterase